MPLTRKDFKSWNEWVKYQELDEWLKEVREAYAEYHKQVVKRLGGVPIENRLVIVPK